jgi:hypothetical protein
MRHLHRAGLDLILDLKQSAGTRRFCGAHWHRMIDDRGSIGPISKTEYRSGEV